MPKTTKPCPGCGKVDRYRKADTVCSSCAHAIEQWPKYLEKVNTAKDLITVKLKGAPHWYPLFYSSGPRCHIPELNEIRDNIGVLFWRLGELSCAEILDWRDDDSPKGYNDPNAPRFLYEKSNIRHQTEKWCGHPRVIDYPSSEGSGDSSPMFGKMNSETLETLRELWDNTARIIELAYLGGLQDGRNLLLQLSSGELSSVDLEERDRKIAQKVQDAKYLHKKLRKKRRQKEPDYA